MAFLGARSFNSTSLYSLNIFNSLTLSLDGLGRSRSCQFTSQVRVRRAGAVFGSLVPPALRQPLPRIPVQIAVRSIPPQGFQEQGEVGHMGPSNLPRGGLDGWRQFLPCHSPSGLLGTTGPPATTLSWIGARPSCSCCAGRTARNSSLHSGLVAAGSPGARPVSATQSA
jgi:hypothetical protein